MINKLLKYSDPRLTRWMKQNPRVADVIARITLKLQTRSTIAHLKLLQEARAKGYKGTFTEDPRWLVEQALNRRGGFVDDPQCRGSALPLPDGRYPPKAGGDSIRHLRQLVDRIRQPQLRIYETELGEWGPYLKKRFPHRFSRGDE